MSALYLPIWAIRRPGDLGAPINSKWCSLDTDPPLEHPAAELVLYRRCTAKKGLGDAVEDTHVSGERGHLSMGTASGPRPSRRGSPSEPPAPDAPVSIANHNRPSLFLILDSSPIHTYPTARVHAAPVASLRVPTTRSTPFEPQPSLQLTAPRLTLPDRGQLLHHQHSTAPTPLPVPASPAIHSHSHRPIRPTSAPIRGCCPPRTTPPPPPRIL